MARARVHLDFDPEENGIQLGAAIAKSSSWADAISPASKAEMAGWLHLRFAELEPAVNSRSHMSLSCTVHSSVSHTNSVPHRQIGKPAFRHLTPGPVYLGRPQPRMNGRASYTRRQNLHPIYAIGHPFDP